MSESADVWPEYEVRCAECGRRITTENRGKRWLGENEIDGSPIFLVVCHACAKLPYLNNLPPAGRAPEQENK